MALFKVLLVESAAVWFDSLLKTSTNSWVNMKMAFETRYNPPGFMKYQYANDLFNTNRGTRLLTISVRKCQGWLGK